MLEVSENRSTPKCATVLGVLQNAYSAHYSGRKWPRRSWLRALAESRSGTRLRVLEAAAGSLRFHYVNATPAVASNPNEALPACLKHLRRVYVTRKPFQVVAFGQSATLALRQLPGVSVLALPHPAYRLLTNHLYELAGRVLATGVIDNMTFTQKDGFVAVETTRYGSWTFSPPPRGEDLFRLFLEQLGHADHLS